MRTKTITVAGKDYWIAYSAQSEISMEALRRDPAFDMKTHGAEFAFQLLAEEMRAGYRWAQLNGRTANEPPAAADLADMIGREDLFGLLPDLNEIAVGERNVIAKPSKKAKAGPSES